MTAVMVQSLFPVFHDAQGKPLDGGYVYIGMIGVNPETHPVPVYWDAARTIPAAQPIRTIAGFPSRNGSPAAIFTDGDVSVTLRDAGRSLVWSALDGQTAQAGFMGQEPVYFFSGSGTSAPIVLPMQVSGPEYLRVFVNGNWLRPGIDFTANGYDLAPTGDFDAWPVGVNNISVSLYRQVSLANITTDDVSYDGGTVTAALDTLLPENVVRLSDYLHPDDLAAIMAGNTALQTGSRVTAAINLCLEEALAAMFAVNGVSVVVDFVPGIYRIDNRLMSDAFNTALWNAPTRFRSRLWFRTSGAVTFRVQGWVPGRASMRTDGIYAGSAHIAPHAVFEWFQRSGFQNFGGMDGQWIIEGADNPAGDPIGWYFYRLNATHILGNIECRNLRNRNFVFDSIFNSKFDYLWSARTAGLMLTECGGTGLLPNDTVSGTTSTGLRYTVSGTTLTINTMVYDSAGPSYAYTPYSVFTADHVGKWIALDRQGVDNLLGDDIDDSNEGGSARRSARWFQIASVTDGSTVELTEAPPWQTSIGQMEPQNRTFSFEVLKVSTTAGSTSATLSMPITQSLVGLEVVIPGAGYDGGPTKLPDLVAMVTAHSGTSITLSHAARISKSDVPFVTAPQVALSSLSHTALLSTSRKCDDLHFGRLWCESGTAPALPLHIHNTTNVTLGDESKLHGSPSTTTNFGANFACVMGGEVGARLAGRFTHSRHSPQFGLFYITGDRAEIKMDGELSSWTADNGSAIWYLDPANVATTRIWDIYYNASDYAYGFPQVAGGQVFERGGVNWTPGRVKAGASQRSPRGERPVWPQAALPAVRSPALGGARADAVSAVARGWVPENGVVYTIGGLQYIGVTGSTLLPGLPGLEPYGDWTPLHFGAVGDGVTDDGAVLNTALAAYRTRIEAAANQMGSIQFSGLDLNYRSTVSLNFTHCTSWGWHIKDMRIVSDATGKTALDLIGSRGGGLTRVHVRGDKTNRPRLGIMACRSAAGGQEEFCDHVAFTNVITRGFFSLSAAYFYGQESSPHHDCEYWNSDPNAHCVIIAAIDVEPVQSDYVTGITGKTSAINQQYSRCDFRHMPEDGVAQITGMTLANPLQITVNTAAIFTVNDVVVFGEQVGAPELVNVKATITNISGNVLTFGAVDASAWTAYVSGGQVIRAQTKPSLLIAGSVRGHTFDDCYFVNYGADDIEIRATAADADRQRSNIHFRNACCEGYGKRSLVRWVPNGSTAMSTLDFTFTTYQSRTTESLFSADNSGHVILQAARLVFPTIIPPYSPRVFDSEARFALYNADLSVWNVSAISMSSMLAFNGVFQNLANGAQEQWRTLVRGSQRLAPITGTLYSLEFDNAGAVGAYIRYNQTSDALSISMDGSNDRFIYQQAAFYPGADTAVSLGLANRRWSDGFFNNLRTASQIGYQESIGAGGSVTQTGSKSSAVTRNSRSGLITMHDEALAAGASVEFTVNNTAVTALTQVMANITGAFGGYRLDVVRVTAGLFVLRLTNTTGGSLSEAVTIQFSLFNGATT